MRDEATDDAPQTMTNDSLEPSTQGPRAFTFVGLAVVGAIGLIASVVLSMEALTLAANPMAQLECSINTVFDCAAVANSEQSKLLGIPNAFLGLMLQPVIIALAIAKLGGARLPRWFMAGFNGLMLLSVGHAHWLLYQSTFIIEALCLWCLTLFVCTLLTFFLITRWNLLEGNLPLPGSAQAKGQIFASGGWIEIALIAWVAVILGVEAVKWAPAFL